MRGLVRNNFYSMSSNIYLSFIIAAVLALVSVIFREALLTSMILAVQIFIFVVHTGASLRIDETSKWSKFELTLPIRRHTIVSAKYASFALLILMGILSSLLTLAACYVTGLSLDPSIVIFSYGFGLTLAITSVALMYPIMLKIGTEKNELIVFFSGFAAIGIMLLLAALLAPFTGGMQFRHPLVSIVSACTSMLLFIISYLVSIRIHRTKEFR